MAPRLSALLVQDRVVSFRQMDAAVQRQRQHGGRIGSILLELGVVDEAQLSAYLTRQRSVPCLAVDELARATDEAIATMSRERALAWACLPVSRDGNRLTCAVLDPLDPELRQRIESEVGCTLDERLVLEFRYWQAASAFYGVPIPVRYQELAHRFVFPREPSARATRPRNALGRRISLQMRAISEDMLENSAFGETSHVPGLSQIPGVTATASLSHLPGVTASLSHLPGVTASPSDVPHATAGARPAAEAPRARTMILGAGVEVPMQTVSAADVAERLIRSTGSHAARRERTGSSASVAPGTAYTNGSAATTSDTTSDMAPDAPTAAAASPAPARAPDAGAPRTAPSTDTAPSPLEELLSLFETADDRDAMLSGTLDYVRRHVPRAWLLLVQKDQLRGFSSRGSGVADERLQTVRVPLPKASPLENALDYDLFMTGTPTFLSLDAFFAEAGVVRPAEVAVVPIRIAQRPALLLVVDGLTEALPARTLPQLLVVVHSAGVALTRLVRARRERRSDPASRTATIDTPAREATPAALAPPSQSASDAWSRAGTSAGWQRSGTGGGGPRPDPGAGSALTIPLDAAAPASRVSMARSAEWSASFEAVDDAPTPPPRARSASDVAAEASDAAAPVEAAEEVAPVEAAEEAAPVEAAEEAAPVEAAEEAAPVEAAEGAAPVEAAEEAAPVEVAEEAAPVEAAAAPESMANAWAVPSAATSDDSFGEEFATDPSLVLEQSEGITARIRAITEQVAALADPPPTADDLDVPDLGEFTPFPPPTDLEDWLDAPFVDPTPASDANAAAHRGEGNPVAGERDAIGAGHAADRATAPTEDPPALSLPPRRLEGQVDVVEHVIGEASPAPPVEGLVEVSAAASGEEVIEASAATPGEAVVEASAAAPAEALAGLSPAPPVEEPDSPGDDIFDISMLPVDGDASGVALDATPSATPDSERTQRTVAPATNLGADEDDWAISRLPSIDEQSGLHASARDATDDDATDPTGIITGPRPQTQPLPVQPAAPVRASAPVRATIPQGRFGVLREPTPAATAPEPVERAIPRVTQQARALTEGAPRSVATLTLDAALVGHLLVKADDPIDHATVDDGDALPASYATRPLDALPESLPTSSPSDAPVRSNAIQALPARDFAAQLGAASRTESPAAQPPETAPEVPRVRVTPESALSWEVPDEEPSPALPRPSARTPIALDVAMPGVLQPTVHATPTTDRDQRLRDVIRRSDPVDLVGLLTSDEQLLRDHSFVELLERGQAAWPALLQNFPGPLTYSRTVGTRPTEPIEAHGPVIWLIALQLRTLAPYLTTFVESSDPSTRYYAVHLLARLGDPAYLDAVAPALFDRDEEIRDAALAFADASRGAREHAALRLAVRHRIESDNPAYVSLAAAHAAHFRDRLAVGPLVAVLDRHDEVVRTRIATALRRLTFRDFGTSQRAWMRFLDRHGRADRRAWILSAMIDPERPVREAVASELERIPQLVVNYHPDMERRMQESAQRTVDNFLERARRSSALVAWVE